MSREPDFAINPLYDPAVLAEPSRQPFTFHNSVDGFTATPLHRSPQLAQRWGVREVWLKDETARLGLPSFKIVGALWGAHRMLSERLGLSASGTTLPQLRERLGGSDLGLLTASAGNWGRAVAHVARLLSVRATVLLPASTGPARAEAIRAEGATVEITDADFDETVRRAAQRAGQHDLLMVDTSADPHDVVPSWVSDGNETLFSEIDAELARHQAPTPDVVAVPVGAGCFAAAAARHYRDRATRPLGVEPHSGACAKASVQAGEPVTIPADTPTPMAGMNCGTLSAVAWPDVSRGFHSFCSISDETAEDGMRTLAQLGITAGACSGSVVGATERLLLRDDPAAREELGLGPDSSIVLLLTEGATIPEHHARVTGTSTTTG